MGILLGRTGIVGGAVPSWAPTDVAGCIVWAEGDMIVGLSDGDPIGTAPNGGSGGDFTQVTASKKPLYKINLKNGKPGIRCDGIDDFLVTPHIAHGIGTDPGPTIGFVGMQTDVTQLYDAFIGMAVYDPAVYYSASKVYWYGGGNSGAFDTVLANSTFYVVTCRRILAGVNRTIQCWINGVQEATELTGGADAYSDGAVALGSSRNTGAEYCDGDILALAIWDNDISDADLADWHNYAMTKYAIS